MQGVDLIICAGKSEQFYFATSIGIGMVEVSINLTRLCLEEKPKSLTFVGTAGSYGRKDIFDISESKTAYNIENSFFKTNAYTPIDNSVTSKNNAGDVSRETIVNSSNYITTDESIGEAYLKKNIDLENMEFYAVLKVAQFFDIPASGIFIVTNYCNKDAHKDFTQNHVKAMSKLTEYMKEN
jgi:purine-nucleoside phosphorylase